MSKRKNIYNWDDNGKVYNPYLHWLKEYVDFLNENRSITLFHELHKYIHCWRLKSKIIRQIELKCFLRKIPQAAYWKEDQIQNAKVLFISNEPGLTDVETLYEDFVEKDLNFNNEECLKFIAEQFKKSMESWLALIDHEKLKKINGENITQEELDSNNKYRKFKKYGKIAYFLTDGKANKGKGNFPDPKDCKCIHIDLFPFAQANGYDKNPLNFKEAINKCITEGKIDSKDREEDCKQNVCQFTCKIIKKNQNIIKDFCKDANDINPKFVFIIGNRAHIYDSQLRSWPYNESQDNAIIIYQIVKLILSQNNPYIKIRISKFWPKDFKEWPSNSQTQNDVFQVFSPTSIKNHDKDGEFIELISCSNSPTNGCT